MKDKLILKSRTFLLLILFSSIFWSGCNNQQGAEVPVADNTFDVLRRFQVVWATLTSTDHLDKITDNSWHDLLAGGMVSTDINGEAKLRSDTCQELYVYQESGIFSDELVIRPCSKYDGADDCSDGGTYSFDECPVSVVTVPGSVTWDQTWLSVTYLDDEELTLVTVHEGEVVMTPVDPMGGAPEFVIEPGQFAYMVTTDNLEKIGERLDLRQTPPNTPLPLPEMVPLVDAFQLEPWMLRMNIKLIDRGLPPDLPLGNELDTILTIGGGIFENPEVGTILFAETLETVADNEFLISSNQIAYISNPDAVRQTLDQNRLPPEGNIHLVYISRDRVMGAVARTLAENLQKIGFEVTIEPSPDPNMAQEQFKQYLDAGEAVFILGK